jgi:hypothetical protein
LFLNIDTVAVGISSLLVPTIFCDPVSLALSRCLVNAEICPQRRIRNGTHEQKHAESFDPLANTPKLSRIGLSLIMTALLCGLTVSGLSSYSDAQTQTTASGAGVDHPGWVQSPGQLIRPDCVHEIPKGAMVELTSDGQISGDVTLNGVLIAHYDLCSENAVITRPRGRIENLTNPPGTGNGWVEASALNVALSPSDDIDFMAGNWAVPSYPYVNGALIYLFNGIEPASGNWILQPALQYGAGAAGGGRGRQLLANRQLACRRALCFPWPAGDGSSG